MSFGVQHAIAREFETSSQGKRRKKWRLSHKFKKFKICRELSTATPIKNIGKSLRILLSAIIDRFKSKSGCMKVVIYEIHVFRGKIRWQEISKNLTGKMAKFFCGKVGFFFV